MRRARMQIRVQANVLVRTSLGKPANACARIVFPVQQPCLNLVMKNMIVARGNDACLRVLSASR
eukprot:4186617-Amphidinium_carterae.1